MPAPLDAEALVLMTRDIVIAEISHNQVPAEAVPTLILRVHESLTRIAESSTPAMRAFDPEALSSAPSGRMASRGSLAAGSGVLDQRRTLSAQARAERPADPTIAASAEGERGLPKRPRASEAAPIAAASTAAYGKERGPVEAESGDDAADAQADGDDQDETATTGEPQARTARMEGREPAVTRANSVEPDFIVCLFDGVKRKMLKRHIKTRYGMSPEAYRAYWELDEDYPMTAPNYSTEKREYAMLTGFGLPRAERRRRSA